MSTLIASVLLVACAVAIVVVAGPGRDCVMGRRRRWSRLYAITMFTVTAGVLLGGEDAGFLRRARGGDDLLDLLAAAVLRYAATSRAQSARCRSVAAWRWWRPRWPSCSFRPRTLDGIFRVVVFIVVGLVLLGMGAGYARLLAQQDSREGQT